MNFVSRNIAVACAAALWSGPTLVRANVGDTLADLRGRYGSASAMGGQMSFEVRLNNGQIVPARGGADAASHLTITVYFDGEHSAMEIFARNTSDPTKANLAQADVDAILAATAEEGQTWHPIEVPTGRETWVRSDKKLIARFSPNKDGSADSASVLVIMLNADK